MLLCTHEDIELVLLLKKFLILDNQFSFLYRRWHCLNFDDNYVELESASK